MRRMLLVVRRMVWDGGQTQSGRIWGEVMGGGGGGVRVRTVETVAVAPCGDSSRDAGDRLQ